MNSGPVGNSGPVEGWRSIRYQRIYFGQEQLKNTAVLPDQKNHQSFHANFFNCLPRHADVFVKGALLLLHLQHCLHHLLGIGRKTVHLRTY